MGPFNSEINIHNQKYRLKSYTNHLLSFDDLPMYNYIYKILNRRFNTLFDPHSVLSDESFI